MRAAGANEDHPANAFPSHESAGKLQSRYFEKERNNVINSILTKV
jgi:hypothetical protein